MIIIKCMIYNKKNTINETKNYNSNCKTDVNVLIFFDYRSKSR